MFLCVLHPAFKCIDTVKHKADTGILYNTSIGVGVEFCALSSSHAIAS